MSKRHTNKGIVILKWHKPAFCFNICLRKCSPPWTEITHSINGDIRGRYRIVIEVIFDLKGIPNKINDIAYFHNIFQNCNMIILSEETRILDITLECDAIN